MANLWLLAQCHGPNNQGSKKYYILADGEHDEVEGI